MVCQYYFLCEIYIRQNAIRLEEKEKREKELLCLIIDEANEYKTEFISKRKLDSESNKSTNREKEKVQVYLHHTLSLYNVICYYILLFVVIHIVLIMLWRLNCC